jgi:hypothetical protein
MLLPKAEGYTRAELKKSFNKYSTKNDDLDEFIAAMIKTGQLQQKDSNYFPTDMKLEQDLKTPEYRVYDTSRYGGMQITKKGAFPRLAIAGLKTDERPDPFSMYLVSYQDDEGNWQPIDEQPHVLGNEKKPAKPRESERWRVNIPAEIVRNPNKKTKQTLKPYMPIRVRIDRIVPQYFSILTLWGYKLGGMISFGQTSKHKEDRKIEIRAENFNMETYGKIKNEIKSAGSKLIKTVEKWLALYDVQYYEFFNNCGNLATKHTGEYIEPLSISAGRQSSIMEFEDMDSKNPAVVYTGILPHAWVERDASELATVFFLSGQDYVVHGYKGRNRKYKVTTKKGTEKTVSHRVYSKKKSELKFSNKPGYK